ncbi:hypothetical protein [Streptomyces sp. NBC_01233]|uniref:hypothetical protein n=1 Tax=Streptomyces sp. NBC_01233 TaxID=2903787 RepID=UPI002E15394A|nr:hypothetical protein OG332_10535 [Streptomyces sp. NBC_01233]
MRGPLAVLRALVPSGRHRATTPAVLIALDLDAEPGEFAVCPAEQVVRYHAVQADGARRCWTCSTVTEAGA